MLKRCILLLSTLFITSALAEGDNSYFIQITNAGLYHTGGPGKHLPSPHSFSYVVTMPAGEVVSGYYDPAAGTLAPPSGYTAKPANIRISRTDSAPLTAHVKIIDPEAGGRIVWEGDVNRDTTTNQASYVVDQVDSKVYYANLTSSVNDFQIQVALKVF